MINRPFREKAGFTLMSMLLLTKVQAASALLYGVDAGIGETDNVTLVHDNKVSQTIAVADADFQYQQQSRLLDADARGNFSFFDYLQGAYGSQFIGRFDGLAKLAILPGRLNWTLQETFGQQQLDPFGAVTPNNQEHVNYISTGPDLSLRMGYTGFMHASVRAARVDYQTSPFDSNRFSGSLGFGRQISASSSLSIEGSSERVLFDDLYVNGVLTNVDFTRSSLFAHYELAGARTSLLANVGATIADQGGSKTTGPLIRLSAARKLSTAATLTITAERDVTDSSTSFAGLQGGGSATLNGGTPITGVPNGNVATAPSAQASTNYTLDYINGGWSYVRNRTTLNATIGYEKDRYAGQPQLDLHRILGNVGFERRMTEALTGQLGAGLYRTSYSSTNFGETDWTATAALAYRVGRALEIKMRYDHAARNVSGIGDGTGYGKNGVFLTIGYRPRTRTGLQPNLQGAPAVLGTPVQQQAPLAQPLTQQTVD